MNPIAHASARAKAAQFSAPRFSAKAVEGAGELYVYDDIGAGWFSEGVTPKGVADALKAMGKVKTLNVYINSPGGSVFDGVAIYNEIRRFDAKKVCHIDGIAASIASVIAMAGDEIVMAHNAQIMIHEAWGMAIGNAADLRDTADLMEKLTEDCVLSSYARTGQTREQLRAWMKAETWMNATEAKQRKFCDAITGSPCECTCPECKGGDCAKCSCDGCATCDAGECPGCGDTAAAAKASPLISAMAATRDRISDLSRSRFLDTLKRPAASRAAVPGQPGRTAAK